MLSPQDQAVLEEWESIARRLRERYAAESDGSVANALMLEKKLYHQFLHFLERNKDKLSQEGLRQVESLEKPEPHMMFQPDLD
jgi:hypothetical protein